MLTNASPYTFRDFVTDLELITTVESIDEEKIRKIARKMKLLLSAGEDFLAEVDKTPRPDRYARHLIHTDRKNRFIVVCIVWGPGQGTPVHDHTTWGVAGVVHNELRIVNYVRLDDGSKAGYAELREASSISAPSGAVTYVLPPNEEIHLIENTTDKTTISVHVYGREIFQCNKFDVKAKSYKQWSLGYENK
jgi:predicted metal-dependent enzyme (double-stranded beta helix superfamily)